MIKTVPENLARSSQALDPNEQQPLKRLTVGVDLTSLLPGGANGGHKIAIISQLEELRRVCPGRFRFVFLTSTLTHEEVRTLEREGDQSLCILDLGTPVHAWNPKVSLPFPKLRFYRDFGVDLFYCPFGDIRRVPPGFPVVAWIADVLHRDYPQSISLETRDWREASYQLLANGADYIQANSRFTADRLGELYGIDQNRIFVTHLAPRRLPGEGAASDDMPYFLYPANFWMHKNHECLLIAYYHYLQAAGRAAWDLRMTGSPNRRMDYLQRLSQSLGIERRTHFSGFLDTRQFAEVASNASALVFPSLYEGFGMPVAEAMLLGIPIIASNAASIPEVGGNACRYVDARKPLELAEAMLRISTDPAYRAQLTAAGRERVKQFSATNSASVLGRRLFDAASRQRDWRYHLSRWKNTSNGLLLDLKNAVFYHLRRWKAKA